MQGAVFPDKIRRVMGYYGMLLAESHIKNILYCRSVQSAGYSPPWMDS